MMSKPDSLEQLISEIKNSIDWCDLPEKYLLEHNYPLGKIGEYSYGTSYTPSSWVLPFLKELKKLKEEGSK